jgi:hypothetical protein
MIYNVELLKGLPHLVAAVPNRRVGSGRRTLHAPRAKRPTEYWTRQQFLTAVVGTLKARIEAWFTRIWGWIRHIWNDLFRRGH